MYQKTRNAVSVLSVILFPLTFYYFSPVIPLGGSAAGVLSGSLILFIFLFFFSMVMGRVFCSWICPAGIIQDLVGNGRTKAVNPKKISWIKYLVWFPWLMLIIFLFRRAGGISNVDFFYQTEYGVSLTRFADAVIYGIVVLVFFILSLAFGRRTACHTICWMSPFMILGRKMGQSLSIPSLKLKARGQECVSCSRCDKVCPMSLPVEKLVKKGKISDLNCIQCGKCADVCGRNILSFSFVK